MDTQAAKKGDEDKEVDEDKEDDEVSIPSKWERKRDDRESNFIRLAHLEEGEIEGRDVSPEEWRALKDEHNRMLAKRRLDKMKWEEARTMRALQRALDNEAPKLQPIKVDHYEQEKKKKEPPPLPYC